MVCLFVMVIFYVYPILLHGDNIITIIIMVIIHGKYNANWRARDIRTNAAQREYGGGTFLYKRNQGIICKLA